MAIVLYGTVSCIVGLDRYGAEPANATTLLRDASTCMCWRDACVTDRSSGPHAGVRGLRKEIDSRFTMLGKPEDDLRLREDAVLHGCARGIRSEGERQE